MAYWQHRNITGPIWFCPKDCYVGGRLIAAPTQTVPLNQLGGNFEAFVGVVLRAANQNKLIAGGRSHNNITDSIRPVVFPWGKQRRRKAPTMQYRTFYNVIQRYNIETWYILQHCYITWPIRFCPKICNVGGRILSAPTRSVPPNFCRGDFGAFVGVVRRAANQNKMIAGGDHTIT